MIFTLIQFIVTCHSFKMYKNVVQKLIVLANKKECALRNLHGTVPSRCRMKKYSGFRRSVLCSQINFPSVDMYPHLKGSGQCYFFLRIQ